MKHIFIGIAIGLIFLGLLRYSFYPNIQSDVPVLYWVTDNNKARKLQVAEFYNWLVENGHITKEGKPKLVLKIDSVNGDVSKQIIQCLSGIGGDIIDVRTGVDQFESMGLLEDITEDAKIMNFSINNTYQSVTSMITTEGDDGKIKQYGFPCNVSIDLLWVNKDLFKKLEIPLPLNRWSFEDFERIGKEFCLKANKGSLKREFYFCWRIDILSLHQSLGLSVFNETLTKCTLDDPRYIKILELIKKWKTEDHILPTKADEESTSTEGGSWGGGLGIALFKREKCALLYSGRWALVSLRETVMNLSVLEPPNGGFPNAIVCARSATIYTGGKHKELAKLFLAYLSSSTYNNLIVDDADALPPDPSITKRDSFLKPEKFSNEWGCHEAFSNSLDSIGIPTFTSPYVGYVEWLRVYQANQERFEANLCTSVEAAKITSILINNKIQQTIIEFPKKKEQYEKDLATQKKIDLYRKEGRQVPESWVKNPFHRLHGLRTGWILPNENSNE